jgi:hypothetical protein
MTAGELLSVTYPGSFGYRRTIVVVPVLVPPQAVSPTLHSANTRIRCIARGRERGMCLVTSPVWCQQ